MELTASLPFYKQIKQQIEARIMNGTWKEGQRLPSQRDLCTEFGVSRITVRQAIGQAIHEGLLEALPGKGTFVKKKRASRGFVRNVTFSEMIQEMGKEPGTKILDCKAVVQTLANFKIFEILDANKLLNLVVLGLADQEPFVLYSSFFEYDLGSEIFEKAKARMTKGLPFSTFDLYQDYFGNPPHEARQTYESVWADQKTSKILKIPLKAPLIRIKTIFYLFNERPSEYREAKYRGDRFVLRVTRKF
jgi:GntR family transcriptional regulator